MNMIVFTDLDGTLLDYSTYSFDQAQPALDLLKRENIPLILCSSKTRKEIEFYRQKLDNAHPFISENGGGIFIPKDYFTFGAKDFGFPVVQDNNYHVIHVGARYADLRKAMAELQKEGFPVKGFGDMNIEEVAAVTGLTFKESEMSKERDFDEPFILNGNETEVQRLVAAIQSKGFHVTQGRFFHILGDSDKGRAVSILIALYKKQLGKILTIALGDSLNDIPMLEKVDYPVIVQKPDGSYDKNIDFLKITKADGIGPDGWNNAIFKIVQTSLS
jgi:mannosyl-3-phosphoglycerate phosphatase